MCKQNIGNEPSGDCQDEEKSLIGLTWTVEASLALLGKDSQKNSKL